MTNKKIVYSQHKDLIPKILKNDEDGELEEQEIQETAQETKAAIDKIVNAAPQLKHAPKQSKYIKYKPSMKQSKERIIRMAEMPVDPLDPPKFKHKQVPRSSGSPPVPVLHSPPRPVNVKDKQDWTIPPCISDWKNAKGYTIPLDQRVAADGRGLQDIQISDGFAKFAEVLYVAEEKAREENEMRSKVRNEMLMKEKERKEQELRALAQKARSERTGPAKGDYDYESESQREEGIQREKIREERRRERESERRLEAMSKKSKITRDRDRDISEKVALGIASTGGRGGEVMYDQRLFNQEKGMNSGFATDDQYNVYDKGLFTTQPTLSTLYKPKKDMDDEMYGNAGEQINKLKNTERFKPDKAFSGASERRAGKREEPVAFEKESKEDSFGLKQWATDVEKGKKPFGSGGTM